MDSEHPPLKIERVLTELRRIHSAHPKGTTQIPFPVRLVTLGWERTAMTNAEGVSVLLEASLVEPAIVVQRALFETMAEFAYFVHHGRSEHDAVKIIVNNIFEFISRAERTPLLDADEDIQSERDRIESLRRRFPAAVAEIERQRKAKQWHWSGLSRSKMIEKALKGSTYYGSLSWEAHSELTLYRDVRPGEGENELRSTYARATERIPDVDRDVADWLWQIWNRFADIWGLDKLPRYLVSND